MDLPTDLDSADGSGRAQHQLRWDEFSAKVSAAMQGDNPWEEARAVYSGLSLSSTEARNQFFGVLLAQEQTAFKELLATQNCSQELRGCIAHRGELFKHSTASELPPALRDGWLALTVAQLDFAVRQSRWSDDSLYLALHALELIKALVPSYSEGDQLESNRDITAVLKALLVSDPFLECVNRGNVPEEAQVIHKAVALARSLNDPLIHEEVEAWVPTLWQNCALLSQMLNLSPSNLYGEVILAAEKDVAAMLAGDFPLSPSVLVNSAHHVDSNDMEHSALSRSSDEYSSAESEDLFNLWASVMVTALEITLLNAERRSRSERAELVLSLVEEAPATMPGYSLALRVLATESLPGLRDFLDGFLGNGLDVPGTAEVLGDLLCATPETPVGIKQAVSDVVLSNLAYVNASDCALLRQDIMQRTAEPSDLSWLRDFLTHLDEKIDSEVSFEGQRVRWQFSFETVLETAALRHHAYGTALDGIERTHPANLEYLAETIARSACSQRIGALVLVSVLAADEAGDDRMEPVVAALSPLLRSLTPEKKNALVSGAESILRRSQVVFGKDDIREAIFTRLRRELELDLDDLTL